MEEKKAAEKAIELWERVTSLTPGHHDATFLIARTGQPSRHTAMRP
jgi:hypothetical protein